KLVNVGYQGTNIGAIHPSCGENHTFAAILVSDERDPLAVGRPDGMSTAVKNHRYAAAQCGDDTDIGLGTGGAPRKGHALAVGRESRVCLPALIIGQANTSAARDTAHE